MVGKIQHGRRKTTWSKKYNLHYFTDKNVTKTATDFTASDSHSITNLKLSNYKNEEMIPFVLFFVPFWQLQLSVLSA